MVCSRCQKRPAIIFVQRMENGQMKNEGFCLHCARELHIKPVEDLMKQFGMSDEDMDNMENRMESMMDEMGDANPLSLMMNMGQPTEGGESEGDDDLVPGSSATFPLGVKAEGEAGNGKKAQKNGKKPPRRKFLDTYCENLTRKAREGRLDDIVGRDREIYRTIQILSRRQKNNPCLIGEAGVGKTAIAEGIAERIAKGDVPVGLKDKEIFLLDLTSLVAGTQFRGQFEQRVKGLLSEVKAAGNIILFIDEIHRLSPVVEEYLYSAMEDYRIDIMIDKGPSARSIQIDLNPFTLVGATTRSGLLTAPLRARFGINLHLEYYDDDILSNIIRRSASILDVPCSLRAAGEIASRSRGTPRIANALLRRVRDFAQVKGSGSIDTEIAQFALEALNIDKYGLDEIDNKILCTIIDKFKGGPVGITTIATALGEDAGTIEEVYEPFLIKEGFMKRTPRGREVTELAYKHLGRSLYNSQKTLFND